MSAGTQTLQFYTFEPTAFTWNSSAKDYLYKDYTELQMHIILYSNSAYSTYSTWLNGGEALTYKNDASAYRLSSQDLADMQNQFKNYNGKAIEVTVQFNPIQALGMSGGFCMYIASWTYTTDPTNPLLSVGTSGSNQTTETLGITCSVVKATSGPTVNQIWNSSDFRSFWLPVSYKAQLDAGTLNLYDDTDKTLQSYRTDLLNGQFSAFRGLQYWKWQMSGGSMLISDKYELSAQTSYTGKKDYTFRAGETVSLYRLSSDTTGKITWSSLQNRTLPSSAVDILYSAASILAISTFLLF